MKTADMKIAAQLFASMYNCLSIEAQMEIDTALEHVKYRLEEEEDFGGLCLSDIQINDAKIELIEEIQVHVQ